jgi:putative inorganic carbon (HCO3(-)) transporter
VVALAVVRVAHHRVVVLPWGWPAVSGVALLLAVVVAAVVAPHDPTAVYGTYGRNSGLLAYGSALMLFLLVPRLFDAASTKVIAFALCLSGLATASYGLLQYAGVDPINWNNPFNPIIATLGNPDFASAYLGICASAAAWAALWTGWSLAWRAAAATTVGLCLVAAGLSEAVQGPLAAGAGLGVLLVAWLMDQRGALRRVGLAVTGVVGALSLGALLAGLAGAGPAAGIFSGGSFRARQWYWEGALTMFRSEPLWGVGLDSYGIRWRVDRPLESVHMFGGNDFSDSAHSVPLQMFAQGGLLLGLTYVAFVGLVLWALVRGLLRLRGQDRLLLGGLGGSWVAYQVQSTVSIDQVPLLVVNFVLAGAIIAASGSARTRELRLPGAVPLPSAAVPARPRRTAAPLVVRVPQPLDHVITAVVVVIALGGGYLSLSPVRAGRSAFAGAEALVRGDGNAALAAYDKALDLAPYVSVYWLRKGELFNAAGRGQEALAAFEDAQKHDPFDVAAARNSGRLAEALGEVDRARRHFERALLLDPLNRDTIVDRATFDLRHGAAASARQLLEDAVTRLPDDNQILGVLGDARLVTGDREGARAAYERALIFEPGQPTATEGLKKLDRAAPAGS